MWARTDRNGRGGKEEMSLPEFAKDMRVPVNYRDHVIDNSAIAWVFYERHKQHEKTNEPAVTIVRRKERKRKRVVTLDISRCVSRDHTSDTVAGRAGFSLGGPLFVHHFLSLLAGVGRLMHIHVSPGTGRPTP
jgi:hypothetical protein